jgi:hydrogenase maturation protease
VTKEILVAGLGNALMSDEGVGIAVLERLREMAQRFPRAEFVDLGAAAMRVVHVLAGRRKAVFIDCAFMDEDVGVIRRFTPEQVRSHKVMAGISLHEGDLLEVIELARAVGHCPEDIVIFGVQPASLAPGEALSPALASRLDEYVEAVAAELE